MRISLYNVVLSETDQFRDGRWAILGTKPYSLLPETANYWRIIRQQLFDCQRLYLTPWPTGLSLSSTVPAKRGRVGSGDAF